MTIRSARGLFSCDQKSREPCRSPFSFSGTRVRNTLYHARAAAPSDVLHMQRADHRSTTHVTPRREEPGNVLIADAHHDGISLQHDDKLEA